MAQRQHTHHIDVQTDQPLVTVSIGSEGAVPGGFAKLFNRVVDSHAWAQLSDAARSVYIPMVRFADQRDQFRVKIGQAAIMKYSGLSRSSAKRAIKDLLQHRLIVVIERGGVNETGENESSMYQLLAPAEPRAAKPRSDVQGVQQRTPSPSTDGPTPGPELNPPAGPWRTPSGVQRTHGRGSASGPQLKTSIQELNNRAASPSPAASCDESGDVAVLLEEKGVNAAVARQLAARFPRERIEDVMAAMELRRARGTCDNPGGFIRDALVRGWQVPPAVTQARDKAQARGRAQIANRQARASAAREQSDAMNEEARVERLIESLDHEDLLLLAGSVREKYHDNAAVMAVLNRKPPRECRLMKMEIAAMFGASPHAIATIPLGR